ncbi:hypothetical protein KI387_002057, partial [Taxus chinensis]
SDKLVRLQRDLLEVIVVLNRANFQSVKEFFWRFREGDLHYVDSILEVILMKRLQHSSRASVDSLQLYWEFENFNQYPFLNYLIVGGLLLFTDQKAFAKIRRNARMPLVDYDRNDFLILDMDQVFVASYAYKFSVPLDPSLFVYVWCGRIALTHCVYNGNCVYNG